MSDFDKEAERERLREKYERDKQKRETTEKMSELLLQGATMTNAHCSDCNDPIFRYDGQEFCATCEKPVDRGTGEDAESDGDEQANGKSAGAIEVTSPRDDARVSFGGNSPDETPEHPDDEGRATEETPQTADDSAEQAKPSAEQPQQRTQPTGGQSPQSRRQQSHTGATDATASGADADVAAVRDSLVRTLDRFSQQAEACEDPQRAREYLAAAREAAETLEALRR